MAEPGADELMNIADARELLQVSKPRMAAMLKDGTLAWEANPLDHRSKLVRRADVEALVRRAGRGAARGKVTSVRGAKESQPKNHRRPKTAPADGVVAS